MRADHTGPPRAVASPGFRAVPLAECELGAWWGVAYNGRARARTRLYRSGQASVPFGAAVIWGSRGAVRGDV